MNEWTQSSHGKFARWSSTGSQWHSMVFIKISYSCLSGSNRYPSLFSQSHELLLTSKYHACKVMTPSYTCNNSSLAIRHPEGTAMLKLFTNPPGGCWFDSRRSGLREEESKVRSRYKRRVQTQIPQVESLYIIAAWPLSHLRSMTLIKYHNTGVKDVTAFLWWLQDKLQIFHPPFWEIGDLRHSLNLPWSLQSAFKRGSQPRYWSWQTL
jgi:hypothetical protein